MKSKFSKINVIPYLFVAFLCAFFLSGCGQNPTSTTSESNNQEITTEPSESQDETPSEEQGVEKDDETETQTNESPEEDSTETETDTSTSTDLQSTIDSSVATATIKGEFCYPGGTIPDGLRVYVKNASTKRYQYLGSKGAPKNDQGVKIWTMDGLTPGTYVVYLGGADGSGLQEGRFTNSDHTFRNITVKAGETLSWVKPCDFNY